MTQQEIRAAIAALENKLSRFLGKSLTNEQKSVRDEILATLDDLRGQLINAPVTVVGFGNSRNSDGPFASLGEQLQAVMRAGLPNGPVDPRLRDITAAASGLNETVPSDGGFLVQSDFSLALLQATIETGRLAKLCMRVPISNTSNGIKLPAYDETSRASTRFGGILSYWASEAEEKTKSKPKFRQVELNLKKLIGLCYATDELLQDAAALNTVIPQAFASEFGFMVDDAIINGTGAGQPLGILNSGCLVTVSKEAGQSTGTILSENVMKMYARLFAGSEDRAVWLANKNALPQLMQMQIAVGTGGAPIWLPANAAAGRPNQTLMGIPLMFIEQAASVGTIGDLILADLPGGYVLAEKGGIQSDVSIHVRFIYDESTFRFVLRIDGQPVRATALTPYKGGAGNTQSHFIALETR